RACTRIKSRSRNVGSTKNGNRRNGPSDRGDNRALTSTSGMRCAYALAARFGQISASTRTIFAGRIVENARRMTGQKSSGVYMTSIHGGAFLFAKANPVVVVVVNTQGT